MNLRLHSKQVHGIALVMVMLIVVVFALLAGGLAYTMKVETKLARNSSWDMELEWLGRSGIEMAKYVLAQPNKAGQQYDGLNQIWAGGTGETNDALEGLSLTDNKLGHGTFSVKITDADRKFNINLLLQPGGREVLNQGLILMGVDGAESPRIVNAIADWIDPDDKPRVGSTDTESDYYLNLTPPYKAKDGYIDDLTEMMMIKGITPAMYFGSGGGGVNGIQPMLARSANRFNRREGDEPSYPVGFVDLFTALGGQVNFNTATPTVMQLFPAVDYQDAQAIVEWRAGMDGVDGNEDDRPFRNPAEIARVPRLSPEAAAFFSSPQANRFVGVRSSSFEVQVDAQIDAVKRTYIAVLRRAGPNQVVLLYMYWR